MGKLAIVFGHSSGLGLETTRILIEKNYKVVGISHINSPMQSDKLVSITADLTILDQLEAVVSQILNQYNGFNVLIYSGRYVGWS